MGTAARGEELYGDWQTRPLESETSLSPPLPWGDDPVPNDEAWEEDLQVTSENVLGSVNGYGRGVIPTNKYGNVELLLCRAKGSLRMYGQCGCFDEAGDDGRYVHVPSVHALRAVKHCNIDAPTEEASASAVRGISDAPDQGKSRGCVEEGKLTAIPYAEAVTSFRSIGVMKYAPKMDGVVVLREHADAVYEVAYAMMAAKEAVAEEKKTARVLKRWERVYNLVMTRNSLREKYGS